MKRLLSLLTCVALLGAAPVLAQPAELPADARFDQLVSFSTGMNGEDLGTMLTALARAVGLTPIVDDFDEKRIVYDIGEAKPFRQVWALVLTLNDLDYLLQENDVVVIGTKERLARLRTAPAEVVEEGEPRVQRFYRVNNEVDQVVRLITLAVREATAEGLPGARVVMVVATEAQHERVAATLAEYDRPVETVPLEQRTYFLSHANAAALATTLRTTGVVGADEEGAGTLIDTFTVVAEPRTNSLIVTGTANVQARLASLIAELDGPQAQVNVQVRIQEITRRSAFDLGIDWSTGLGNFTANILRGGLSFIFDTTQVISSLNVLAVLDTLETQGLTRRVDDSNLTVLNNGQATIQSGGQIFISLPGSPPIQRTIPYGVQIDITPRITADGRITLEVNAKVEDILSTTNDPTFLNLSSRNMNTTVTVQEGQTLLLGGLLQNSLAVTRQRLPILGAIPLIGDLFGRTVTEEDDVDLLLIVTASVID